MSWPPGQPVRPREKIKYHFSRARFQRASVISDFTSRYDPRMCVQYVQHDVTSLDEAILHL